MRTIAGNKSESDSKSYLDQTAIFGGKAFIFRTPASRDKYQFRIWIPEEKKYFRKSLKTSSKSEAIERAEALYIEIRSKIQTGQRFFGVEAALVVAEYVQAKKESAGRGEITRERVGTISSQLKHFLRFVGGKTIFSQIEPSKLVDYAAFRREHKSSVKPVTIKNEQSTIGSLFEFAFRKGYFHSRQSPDFEKISIKEVGRRSDIDIVEYRRLYRFLTIWVKAEKSVDEKIKKSFVRDFIFIKSNTMLRFGELRQIKWRNIRRYRQEGLGDDVVEIKVPSAIAKTRKARDVYSNGYHFFERIKSYSKFTDADDYVFANQKDGKNPISEKLFYGYWDELMNGADIQRYEGRIVTYYSLRHFAISTRIYADVPLSQIAKIAGTSVQYIETHYDHTQIRKQLSSVLKDVRFDKMGVVLIGA